MYKLDHIVHFVESPEKAMKQLIGEGLHVVEGGKHGMWGTYNTLSYFGSSYVELIGIYDEALFADAATKKYSLHESYDKRTRINGFTRIALRTNSIDKDAEKFRAAGFDVVGPETFQRTRPDQTVVSWQLLHIGHPQSKMDYPFFIQWELDDEERMADLKEREIISSHPAGELQLESISYIVNNFTPVEQLCKLCGVEMTIRMEEQMNAEVATIHIEGGNLVFYRPLGEGMVWEVLMEHGHGIDHIVLSGAAEEKIVYCDEGNYIFRK